MDWGGLPLDIVFQIGREVALTPGALGAMRRTCKHWRAGAAPVDAVLSPLGFPWSYAAFPRTSAVDCGARGHGHALTDAELTALCSAAGARLKSLNLGAAFNLSSLLPLCSAPTLTALTLDGAAVTDEQLSAVLATGGLAALRSLSLRGCAFLRGDFLQHLQGCTDLRRLDLADCALSIGLTPAAADALGMLSSLEALDLGGCNGGGDAVVLAVSALPRLRALGLRGAIALTDSGLEALASGPAAAQLQVLDLEGCSGLSDACWPALARLQALEDLSLARLPHLLRFPAMAEGAAAALWRWPRLRRLSLAGSMPHPSKLKLLAATCGGGLGELDISAARGAAASVTPGSHRGCFARLPPHQLRDLLEAARHLRQLRTLLAPGTGLPAEAAVALMRAAPRLEALDLSGCGAAPRRGRPLSGGGRLWTSGVYMPGGGGAGRRAAAVLSSESGAGTPAEFAAALGALGALRTLRLEGCANLADVHLGNVSALCALTEVSLARNRGVGNATLSALAAARAPLRSLNVGGTGVTDAGLAALAAGGGAALQTLLLAGCSEGVTGAGVAALAGAGSLLELDVSDCVTITGAGIARIAAAAPGLCSISLAGCRALGAEGLCQVAALRRLTRLDVARCGAAVEDDVLRALCSSLTQLTGLNVGGAADLTPAALGALRSLRNLAEIDLTCCAGLGGDEEVAAALPGVTAANASLPQGGAAPTGSPIKRRPNSGGTMGGPLPMM